MILTPHSLVGAVITNLLPEHPAIGFGLAMASHYMLDMIPHSDYTVDAFIDGDTKTVKSIFRDLKAQLHFLIIGADFLTGIILCFCIFVRDEKSLILTLLGLIAGVLPDFLQFLYLKWKRQPWIFTQKIHDYFHSQNKMKHRVVWGYISQFLIAGVCVGVYFFLK